MEKKKVVVLPVEKKVMPFRVFHALMERLERNSRAAYYSGVEFMIGALSSPDRAARAEHFFKLSKYYFNAANVLRSRYFDSYFKGN